MFQLKRNLSFLQNSHGTPNLMSLLNQWRLICEKPPKGFEKFFKPGNGKEFPKNAKSSKEGTKETKPPPSAKEETQDPKAKPKSFDFKINLSSSSRFVS